jgi:hypothetical protein
MSQGYRIWTTPQSPLRIEYSAELLRQVQREGAGDRRGLLYGRRNDTQIRLLGARRAGHTKDPRLNGLDQVGAFAVRSRGEVFLTDQDLEFAERSRAEFTLVLAGGQGGFFVPEKDGSILSIRSHHEFTVPHTAPMRKGSFSRSWLNAVAMAGCLVLAVAAALHAGPKAILTLNVHEEAGQLVAVWSPGVRGTLEIHSQNRSVQLPVPVQETRATFQPEAGDVDFTLTTLDGVTREEHISIVDSPRRQGANSPPLVDQITKLEAEREKLLEESNANRLRLAQLEKMAQR